LLQVFFHESSSPKPLKIALGSKFSGDIRKSRCTNSINDNGGKFATNTAGVNYTDEKLATCINNTNVKFATGISDTGDKSLKNTVIK
jgi:hypothetical protein